jgi:hypothetical protein
MYKCNQSKLSRFQWPGELEQSVEPAAKWLKAKGYSFSLRKVRGHQRSCWHAVLHPNHYSILCPQSFLLFPNLEPYWTTPFCSKTSSEPSYLFNKEKGQFMIFQYIVQNFVSNQTRINIVLRQIMSSCSMTSTCSECICGYIQYNICYKNT